MKRFLLTLPLLVILMLTLVLGKGLVLDPRTVDSPLVGKPSPAFTGPRLDTGDPTSRDDLLGEVTLLNVWASWCVACRQEHPLLNQLARSGEVRVVGLNYKDEQRDGLRWLQQFGDPYVWSVADRDGRIGIDYGVYGVPETFVLDAAGVIRAKHIGPITPDYLRDELLPLVRALKQESRG